MTKVRDIKKAMLSSDTNKPNEENDERQDVTIHLSAAMLAAYDSGALAICFRAAIVTNCAASCSRCHRSLLWAP